MVFYLSTNRQIRETTIESVMPKLDKATMTKALKKYTGIFSPKYRAFNILQNDIENVVYKSKQIWKTIYELTKPKAIEHTPIKVDEEFMVSVKMKDLMRLSSILVNEFDMD